MYFTTGKTPEAGACSTDMAENGHGDSSVPMVSLENSEVNMICFYSYKYTFPLSRKYA